MCDYDNDDYCAHIEAIDRTQRQQTLMHTDIHTQTPECELYDHEDIRVSMFTFAYQ